jgi:Putative transposase
MCRPCLIPGGALTEAGDWHPAKSTYLFPVRALSKHFRGHRVSALRQAADRGELHRITRPGEIDARLDELWSTDWVVYTKAYLSHPDTVVDYLGRYSRKTALNDRRIVGIEDNTVRLRYKDYTDAHPPLRLSRQPVPNSQAGADTRLPWSSKGSERTWQSRGWKKPPSKHRWTRANVPALHYRSPDRALRNRAKAHNLWVQDE